MPLYEHVFLARQDVTAQQVEDMTTQYKGVIESNGGTIAKTEYWGVKTLNFRIKKNRKAHFAYIGIDGPPAAITEMERQMRINEDVLRFMTIRIEAFDEGPTIMMQKRDREERREERRGERRRDRDRDGGEGDDLVSDPSATAEEVTP